ncbi:hypothetical protein [uncultured Ruegeria sp.]|uniref:hypothetical protein n=1 Tax=uncultured Ruegeria sp. TaxID=259304 RepID=UPI00261A74A1|nr:hypothetical protein [uncultured Ruegeria sp.]
MCQNIKLFSIAIAAVGLGTSAIAESSQDFKTAESVLLVQHSDKAAMSEGLLTLVGADKNLIMFTDRPHRAAATIPSEQLVKIWSEGDDSFASDPPNAALVGQQNGNPVSLIVELTNPRASGDDFVFGYKIIEGEEVPEIDQAYIVIDDCFICLGDVANLATGNPLDYILNPNDPK